jgi:hypothetical protein
LKIPVLVDGEGPLFGTEITCRELARRSGKRARVVLRGDVAHRLVANAEPEPPKLRPSLENALGFVEENIDGLLAALPSERLISFGEREAARATAYRFDAA